MTSSARLILERAPARRLTHLAAIGFALAWLIGTCLSAASTSPRADSAATLLALHRNAPLPWLHFALIDGLAAVLFCVAITPAINRITSSDGRFATTFCVASAALVSLLQFCLGTWLVSNASTPPIAYFAAMRTMHDLDGVKEALIAVALISLVSTDVRTARFAPMDSLLIGTSIGLAVTAVGSFTGSATSRIPPWVSTPLLLLAVAVTAVTAGANPSRQTERSPST